MVSIGPMGEGDESESWIPLKDSKESHPVEIAKFAGEGALTMRLPLCGGCPIHYKNATLFSQR